MATDTRRSLFVVDDDPAVADTIAIILAEAGFQVHTFYTPVSAIHAAMAASPDVVVTDFQMPQIDGLALAAWLEKFSPGCRIVMVTAHAEMLGQRMNRRPHFTLLAKPVAPMRLIAAVKEALSISDQRDQNVKKVAGI